MKFTTQLLEGSAILEVVKHGPGISIRGFTDLGSGLYRYGDSIPLSAAAARVLAEEIQTKIAPPLPRIDTEIKGYL